MLDLFELSLFSAFYELGTLSGVAEKFFISTPSVSRAMRNVEEAFGVPLFVRGKNRIELNDTGELAAKLAKRFLENADQMTEAVRDFDRRKRTVVIRSCAPAPLWELQKSLNTKDPAMMLSIAICQNDEVLSAWKDGSCDIAILPFEIEGAKLFMKENLFVCVPEDHELAEHETLTFADINGFNFLLRTGLGFWDTLCRERMPASKFLVQPDSAVFDELVKASSLPCFTTDYAGLGGYSGRVNLPISDPEAHVTFYIAKRGEGRGMR